MLTGRMRSAVGARLPAKNGAGAGEVSGVPAACGLLLACQWRMGCCRHFSRASALLQWVRVWLTLLGGLIAATVRFCWLDDPTNVADWTNADRCRSALAREKWCWRRRGVGCTCCMRAIGGVSGGWGACPIFRGQARSYSGVVQRCASWAFGRSFVATDTQSPHS